MVWEFVVPVATVPKLMADGVPLIAPEVVPVPSTGYCTAELVAVPLNVIEPEKSPVLVGANLTTKLTEPPADIVKGIANPLMLNPVALTVALDMVAGAREAFLKVTEIVCADPTATEPTFPGDGVNANAVVWLRAALAHSTQANNTSHV